MRPWATQWMRGRGPPAPKTMSMLKGLWGEVPTRYPGRAVGIPPYPALSALSRDHFFRSLYSEPIPRLEQLVGFLQAYGDAGAAAPLILDREGAISESVTTSRDRRGNVLLALVASRSGRSGPRHRAFPIERSTSAGHAWSSDGPRWSR